MVVLHAMAFFTNFNRCRAFWIIWFHATALIVTGYLAVATWITPALLVFIFAEFGILSPTIQNSQVVEFM
ncbi:hypothetical protein AL755_18080 [Arthrobacter sp. ERGS1:01]|nr:hypothetical protein AL755_18080 [Arthrobacter sp. ERGS1:01]